VILQKQPSGSFHVRCILRLIDFVKLILLKVSELNHLNVKWFILDTVEQ